MEWFNNRKKRLLEMAQQGGIKATSKNSLKWQCLYCAKGDINEAKELYDYLTSDMQDLPDFDPAPTTWVDTTKKTATDIFSWFKDNQNTIATGYEMVRQMTGNRLPPLTLPVTEPEAPAAELPEINK